MVTISELEAWEPEDLSDVADLLVQRRKTLLDLQDEIDAGKPPADWVGPASGGARQKQQQLKLRLNDLVAEVSDVASSLDTAAEALKTAKADLQSLLSTASGQGFEVQKDPIVVTAPEGRTSEDLTVTPQEVADGLSAALTKANEADADLAASLNAAHRGTIEGGEGTLKQAEQMGDLHAMSPEEQVRYVREHKDFPPEFAAAISPEAQATLARDVAGDIESGNIDSETQRLLNVFQDEQPFAHAVFSQVSPDELADAVDTLNDAAFAAPPDAAIDEENRKKYSEFLKAAGHTFATYTKGEGAYAPPPDLADTYFKAITEGDEENAAALTLMLRHGGSETSYDTGFMTSLADRTYEWERSHDGDPVWGPKDTGIMDPDAKVEISTTYDENGNSISTYSSGHATDGMANILGAMAKSPEAAQHFFMKDGEVDQGRLDYFLGTRDGDEVWARTFSADNLSDEGNGLGLALKAATVGDREHEILPGTEDHVPRYKDEFAADLASDYFNRIADLSGDGDQWGWGDGRWHIWPEMADELGTIAAGYKSDVYDIIQGAPADGPTHLELSGDNLDKVLGEIGRGDKTGIETLSAAMIIEGNERLDDQIERWQEENPGEPLTMQALARSGLGDALAGVGDTNGEVLGHVLNKSVLVDLEDQELAEQRAAYISKALDIAGGFIPGAGSVLGEGASELAKSAFDTVKGEGLDALKSAVESTGEATGEDYRQENRGDTSTALRYSVINQLLANGYLGEQSPDVPGADSAIPSSLLVDGPNGSRVINPDLYDADGVDTIGEEGQYTPQQIQQMRADWNAWVNSTPENLAVSVASQAQDGFDRKVNEGP